MAHRVPLRYTEAMDVLAIGDTTEDIFLGMHDASVQCSIDGKNCMLCLDYGEKIPVDTKISISGVGNAANHAVGVSRLGLSSALYTVVGDDAEGRRAKEVMEKNKVDTSHIVFDKKHGTNLSIVVNFQKERTILVYHEPREYAMPEVRETPSWIYLTSASGEGLHKLHEEVLAYLEKNPSVRLAFNPGTYQINLGKEALLPMLQKTELLFVNREEAARVLEVKTSDIAELVKAFHAIGIPKVVITDGPNGSYASDGRNIYTLAAYPSDEQERTGAGDAYGSGFLSAIISGHMMTDAMQWGGANAASVVQHTGAREGLLEREAMMHFIAEHAENTPKVYATL